MSKVERQRMSTLVDRIRKQARKLAEEELRDDVARLQNELEATRGELRKAREVPGATASLLHKVVGVIDRGDLETMNELNELMVARREV